MTVCSILEECPVPERDPKPETKPAIAILSLFRLFYICVHNYSSQVSTRSLIQPVVSGLYFECKYVVIPRETGLLRLRTSKRTSNDSKMEQVSDFIYNYAGLQDPRNFGTGIAATEDIPLGRSHTAERTSE
ncbi:unnamed protein product [Allacma fusca]|uniref:Uncharacterized protein n=1 Tax=Allacma fusca TaxID=39272 RepID=A0A8J2J806_9HEXA|nr:unnamed protein product [Allacma fusca]